MPLEAHAPGLVHVRFNQQLHCRPASPYAYYGFNPKHADYGFNHKHAYYGFNPRHAYYGCKHDSSKSKPQSTGGFPRSTQLTK